MKFKCSSCGNIVDKCNIKCRCGNIILNTNIIRDLNNIGGKENMATIGEAADNYQASTKTMNIADLDRVSIDLQIVEDSFEFTKGDETKTVTQEVIEIDEVKYRVPFTVKQQLKVLMEDNPKLKFFKVKKSGTTKDDTRYQVIPLIE